MSTSDNLTLTVLLTLFFAPVSLLFWGLFGTAIHGAKERVRAFLDRGKGISSNQDGEFSRNTMVSAFDQADSFENENFSVFTFESPSIGSIWYSVSTESPFGENVLRSHSFLDVNAEVNALGEITHKNSSLPENVSDVRRIDTA